MRSLFLAGACAASMMLALTPVAQAADIVEPPPEPVWSWYVSIFGGWSMADELDGDVEYDGTDYEFEVDLDDGFTAGVAVGAQVNEWLRGEIELSGNWHDNEGEFTYDGATYDVDGDVDALFVLANLWWDIPIGDVFRPYIGGGIGFGRLSIDVDAETTLGTDYSLFDDDDWGFAYQLGAGVAFGGFAENFVFDIGYRYKAINNAEFEGDSDFFTGGGDADIDLDYHSHNIIAGIRIGF